MNTKNEDTQPFDISIEELERMLDLAAAKQAEADARKAEADAKEAKREERRTARQAKAREDFQRAREAEAESLRGRAIIEWMCTEPE